jgi:hypothetical protein
LIKNTDGLGGEQASPRIPDHAKNIVDKALSALVAEAAITTLFPGLAYPSTGTPS